ncbi:MAG TPA: hypothetical protein PLB90_09000 [Opitutaceae bacterium]|nr:hypothetical protein [Opitutaceae bacterium]
MKKSFVYVLAPIVGLIIFGAVYWNFSSTYEANEAAKALKVKQDKEAKALAQARANEQAIREANAGVLRRKAEREAKEAKEKKDRELRVAANDAKEKAYTDKEKFAKQVSRLESDIKIEKDAISKLEEERKRLVEEQAFLRVYVKQAEDNVKSLSTVIDKIAAADAARAAAEAAAAKARRDRDNS